MKISKEQLRLAGVFNELHKQIKEKRLQKPLRSILTTLKKQAPLIEHVANDLCKSVEWNGKELVIKYKNIVCIPHQTLRWPEAKESYNMNNTVARVKLCKCRYSINFSREGRLIFKHPHANNKPRYSWCDCNNMCVGGMRVNAWITIMNPTSLITGIHSYLANYRYYEYNSQIKMRSRNINKPKPKKKKEKKNGSRKKLARRK